MHTHIPPSSTRFQNNFHSPFNSGLMSQHSLIRSFQLRCGVCWLILPGCMYDQSSVACSRAAYVRKSMLQSARADVLNVFGDFANTIIKVTQGECTDQNAAMALRQQQLRRSTAYSCWTFVTDEDAVDGSTFDRKLFEALCELLTTTQRIC